MKSLAKRDKAAIWHPYTQMGKALPPLAIVKGEGIYLFDEKGNKYMDAISSWWVNLHGHAHPHIAKKVYEQLKKLEHVIFAGFTHAPAVVLAERLIKILPSNQNKIFYSDNGSTAVEAAIKMSIQYWKNKGLKKNKIIAFRNSYHGDTFGSMSVSERGAFTAPFHSMLFETLYTDVPVKGKEKIAIAKFKNLVKKHGKNIAAFIYEPLVQGAGGMIMYNPEPINQLLAVCKENGILCIADEVMTGFGRTGKLFASHFMKHKPDMICLSKGITGGTMALGVTSCSNVIYDAFYSNDSTKTFFHGHSYTANPVACMAALASLDILLQKKTQEKIKEISEMHEKFAQEIKKNKRIFEVRYQGTILAIEINTGKNKTSYFNTIKEEAISFFIKKGIIIRPLGNILYLMPPYCIKKKELEFIYRSILEFLDYQNPKE